jgi:hypothetical protein
VRPIPNGSISVIHQYYKGTPWLYDDLDQPTLPTDYLGAVVAKAAELLSQRESNQGDAQRHNAEYKSWVERMRSDMRRSTPPTHVRVRPGGWI